MTAKHFNKIVLLLLVFLALVAYAQATKIFFRADDWIWLGSSKISIAQPSHLLRNWFGDFRSPDKIAADSQPTSLGLHLGLHQGFRPLSELVFYFFYRLFGPRPAVFAVIAIATHIANSYLIYLLVGQLTKRRAGAVVAAVLFLTAVSQLQAVTYASDTIQGLFSTSFILLSLIAFIKAEQQDNQRLWLASIGYFLVALGFKETAIILGPIIFLYGLWLMPDRPWRYRLTRVLPHLLISLFLLRAFFFRLIYLFFHHGGGTVAPVGDATNPVVTWLTNLSTLIATMLPLNRTVPALITTGELAQRSQGWQFYPAVVGIILAVAIFIFLWLRKARSAGLIAWLAATVAIALLPYCTFAPIGGYDGSRYFALPAIGLSIMLGLGLGYFFERRELISRLLAGLLVLTIVCVSVGWVRKGIGQQIKLSQDGQTAVASLRQALPKSQPPQVIIIDRENQRGEFYLYNFAVAAFYPLYDISATADQQTIKVLADSINPTGHEDLILHTTGRIVVYGGEHLGDLLHLINAGALARENVSYLGYTKEGQLVTKSDVLDRLIANKKGLCLSRGLKSREPTQESKLYNLTDGRFGNNNTWLGTANPSWISLTLPTAQSISSFSFSRDRTGAFSDRQPTKYRLESSADGQNWQALATEAQATTKEGITTVNFPPIATKALRFSIDQTKDGLGAAIDELSIDGPKGIVCDKI